MGVHRALQQRSRRRVAVGATGAAAAPVDIERPANEAHQIVSDASGRHVFVPCRSGNVIAQYAFDSASGQLAAANPAAVQAATGAGPRHIAFHPNQQSAYVINELNGTITSYRYDANAGLLSSPETLSAVPAGMNETSSAHVVVHPSGKFVYGVEPHAPTPSRCSASTRPAAA